MILVIIGVVLQTAANVHFMFKTNKRLKKLENNKNLNEINFK